MRFILPFVCAILFSSVHALAQDEPDVSGWVKEAVEKSLDYHCRIKFGDSPETLTANPDKLGEKWVEMSKLFEVADKSPWGDVQTGNKLDREIVLYFKNVQKWEQWMRSQKAAFERQMTFFLIRVASEEIGGRAVRDIYDSMPDRFEEKQDLGKLVGKRLGREVNNAMLQHALEDARLKLIATLSDNNDEQSKAIASQLVRLGRKPEYEAIWLKANRPGLLDRAFVASRQKLLEINAKVASRATPEKLKLIQSCPTVTCRQFAADYALATYYEKQSLPQLGINPAERWTAALDVAYREALNWSAQNRGGEVDPVVQFEDLLRTTNRVFKPRFSSRGEPFDYVVPTDLALLSKQQKLVDLKKEFVGAIDAAEPIQALAVVGDVLLALGKTGIATYSISSGERLHLIYDLAARETMKSMAVSPTGDFVYAVTSESKLVRYDLNTGKRDDGFKSPEIPREDALIAISPDGKWLAIAHISKIYLHDIAKGVSLGESKGPLNLLLYGVSFTSKNRSLLVHGNGPITYEYPLPNGPVQERRIIQENENRYVYRMICQHGAIVASGKGAFAVWPEGADKPLIQTHLNVNGDEDRVKWAAITPDKRHVICANGVWDVATGEPKWRFAPSWNEEAMAISEDGTRFMAADNRKIYIMPTCVSVQNQAANANAKEEAPEMRTWVSGKYKIQAVFVEVVGDKVRLKRADGQFTNVPIKVLSAADQEFVRKLVE